jgi:hypothetical protein
MVSLYTGGTGYNRISMGRLANRELVILTADMTEVESVPRIGISCDLR